MKNAAAILSEIESLVHDGFTGHVTLHCEAGQILRFEIGETRKPGRPRTVDLVEERSPARAGRRD
jgi:hypothetical protein